jgi:Flp pilus assembly protein TadG
MVGEAPTSGFMKAPLAERLPRPRALVRRLRLEERGTALIEFALVAPVLFLLIFGVLDFSLALNDYNQASQLVGLGARAAAVNRNPDGTQVSGTSIQTQLAEQYAHGGLHNNPVCITLPNGAGAGQPVTVTSTFQFHLLPLLSAVVGSPTVSISASQTERQEITGTYSTGCAS